MTDAIESSGLVTAVSEWTAAVLRGWSYRMQFETLRAVALDAHPWHGWLWVSSLTENEVPLVQEAKWAIGDWRWAQTETVSSSLKEMLQRSYEEHPGLSKQENLDRLFLDFASGLKSIEVGRALEAYNLSEDFEFGVFNPDSPSDENYVDQLPT